jgi:hypothetical protein
MKNSPLPLKGGERVRVRGFAKHLISLALTPALSRRERALRRFSTNC